MLDLPLDDLAVGQANAGNEISRPALIGDLGVHALGAHGFPVLRGPGLAHISSSHSRMGRWPASIFSRASSGENQPPRSTSGKDCIRPERGGHSNSNKLLFTLAASQLPSTAQASTSFPLGCLKVPSGTKSPSTAKPVSSWNSRRAQARGSSPSSSSPLGIDQAPASLFFQNGPPGCTRKTSRPLAGLRYIKMPAVRLMALPYGDPGFGKCVSSKSAQRSVAASRPSTILPWRALAANVSTISFQVLSPTRSCTVRSARISTERPTKPKRLGHYRTHSTGTHRNFYDGG